MWSGVVTFMRLCVHHAEELPELEQRAFINRITSRRMVEIDDFERNWG
jgi:hypothetical protein